MKCLPAVAVVGLAVVVRCHANDLVTPHFCNKRATNAAISARGLDAVLRQPMIDDAFFHQSCGRTSLYACATGNALGVEKVLADSGRHLGVEATTFNRQCERALNLVTGAHATRADDALARIELEIRVTRVHRCFEVIYAVEAVRTSLRPTAPAMSCIHNHHLPNR